MNELLRLANEMREARKAHGKFEPYVYAEDAFKVIKGYQELIRRMAETLNDAYCYINIDRHPDICAAIDSMITEGKRAIPEEQSNE